VQELYRRYKALIAKTVGFERLTTCKSIRRESPPRETAHARPLRRLTAYLGV
jgi:hypothetical protein